MRYILTIFTFFSLLLTIVYPCTDIIVGKKASADGSIIVSHTGCGPDCRVRFIPGKTYSEGEKAPVYFGLIEINSDNLEDYGEILGYIPQVKETYGYFHSAYSQMNEHQLAIGESTISQRKELQGNRESLKQIMSIEQTQIFALQRCKTAREAVELIGGLMSTYGFLPTCADDGESLCIADKNEVWIFEVFSVGADWDPSSGKDGAVWAAQRVPDDHIAVIPNWSNIKQIDISQPDWYRTSENYMQFAIDKGWYNPDSGMPFVWQNIYAPIPREWATGRFWLFYKTFGTPEGEYPERELDNPFDGMDPYHQYVEPLSIYPFSFKPSKKISVQDVIAFQRQTFEGTIYDMTSDPDWYVPNKDGVMEKSPLTTPFPTKPMRQLLDINYRRNVSRGGYGMVIQVRDWLPDPVGGLYWFYLDNQYVSSYVPIYAGVQNISKAYRTYNPDKYDENSARWQIDMADNLMYLRWQDANKDLQEMRNPMEKGFFDAIPEIDKKAAELFKEDPQKAKDFLTEFTNAKMDESVEMFRELIKVLITKYTNNNQG
ncbi:MAG: C69 family dipeptidase [Bacteroidetes bacterium]|nr:C69 family dipeptidase [Bacteroidota bacterium]